MFGLLAGLYGMWPNSTTNGPLSISLTRTTRCSHRSLHAVWLWVGTVRLTCPNSLLFWLCLTVAHGNLDQRARRRVMRAQLGAIMLSLTIFALFISTTTYLAITIISYQANFLQAFLWSGYELWFEGANIRWPPAPDGELPVPLTKASPAWPPFCARTATFMINVRVYSINTHCIRWAYDLTRSLTP